MKGMLLAAGKGTRIRPITYELPKPMIPLIRKPVMEYIIEHLKSHGVDQLIINTSHLAPLIEDYFRDGNRLGVQIAYSFEGELVDGEIVGKALGSAGGMKRVQDFSGFFSETFIVVCGDAVIDLDIAQAVEFHKSRKAIATIILKDVPASDVWKYGVVKSDDDGKILQFQEKPKIEEAVSRTINTGIYIFEPGIFDFIPAGREFDIGGNLLPELVKNGGPVYGMTPPFQWIDIGSVADYWEASMAILTGKVKGYGIPGKEVKENIHAGINVSADLDKIDLTPPVYIGSSTSIGPGARIYGPALIGSGCVIEPGAVIRECLVGDYTRISSAANLERTIVFGNKCIDPSGKFMDIDELDIGWIVDDARKKWAPSEIHRLLMETAKDVKM